MDHEPSTLILPPQSGSAERAAAAIWRNLGFLAACLYVAISFLIPACLIADSVTVDLHTFASLWPVLWTLSWNSLIISLPAAFVCVVCATYVAYRLRFVSPPAAVIPVIFLLAPFFSSPIALYGGFRLLFGPGPLTFGIGLVFRYFPVALIFIAVSMYSVPLASKVTLHNLRVSDIRLFVTIAVPKIFGSILLIFTFLTLVMPLDILGGSIAGGGQLQTFGNIIFDYSHTVGLQNMSALLTLVFFSVSGFVIFLMIILASRQRFTFTRHDSQTVFFQSARAVYFNPVFLLYVGVYLLILLLLIDQGGAPLPAQDEELEAGAMVSFQIVFPVTVMTAIIAMFVVLWLHLSQVGRRSAFSMIIAAALLIPPLLPAVLSGRMAANVQGLFDVSGGSSVIAAWYVYFFGALPILVLTSHPIIFDSALPKIAVNHRIAVEDYVFAVVLPALLTSIIVGAGLFAAVATSDSIIARYTGGPIKTLAIVLENHQYGALSSYDYVFMGALGLWTLAILVAAGFIVFSAQKRLWHPESQHQSPSSNTL
jgi:ABC-type spermidine/putrescine transport system permease subunit II